MTMMKKAGLASATLLIAAGAAGVVSAADLGGYPRGGSIKDGGYAPPQVGYAPAAGGPCYFRGDLGYSWSRSPDAKWPVNNLIRDYTGDPADNTTWTQTGTTTTYIGDGVTDTSLENTWFGGVGVGCGTGGDRGIRGEVMFGYHGSRKFDGTPGTFTITDRVTPPALPPVTQTPDVFDDPLHTSITSYTMMFNAYKDLGKWGAVTPYVGAGVGLAYNISDDYYFTGNPNLVNRIHGGRDLAFAWSLMAGVGVQVSNRATVDLGYRYMDFGKVSSERSDSAGFINPRVHIDDLAAHEFKIGLRYNFGASDCCAAPAPAYVPMK